MHTKTVRGIIYALLAGTCWGFSGTVGQYLFTEKGVDPGWLTTVRLLVSGLILLIWAAVRKREQMKTIWMSKETAGRLLFFAVFGLMSVQYSYMASISCSNAGTATAIQYLGEALILLVTCVSMRRLPKITESFGLILALAGVFLLATHGNTNSMVLSGKGLFWGLISAVALMLYTLLPAKLIAEYGSQVVTGYGMTVGGVVLAILMRPWHRTLEADWLVFLGMAVIILVGTVLAFTVFLQSTVDIGGVKAGLLASTETIAAPFFAALWLHTKFETADFVGFVCMLVMVVLLALPDLGITVREKSSDQQQNAA